MKPGGKRNSDDACDRLMVKSLCVALSANDTVVSVPFTWTLSQCFDKFSRQLHGLDGVTSPQMEVCMGPARQALPSRGFGKFT